MASLGQRMVRLLLRGLTVDDVAAWALVPPAIARQLVEEVLGDDHRDDAGDEEQDDGDGQEPVGSAVHADDATAADVPRGTRTVPVVVRMPEDLYASLRARAAEEERSVANVMRRALRHYVDRVPLDSPVVRP